jgi:hypothetical protein
MGHDLEQRVVRLKHGGSCRINSKLSIKFMLKLFTRHYRVEFLLADDVQTQYAPSPLITRMSCLQYMDDPLIENREPLHL